MYCSLSSSIAFLWVVLLAWVSTGSLPQPEARDDAATATAGQQVILDVLANDAAPGSELDPASLRVVEAPRQGTARVDEGTIRYEAPATFEGPDALTYTVADTSGAVSNIARVDLTVTPPISDEERKLLDESVVPDDLADLKSITDDADTTESGIPEEAPADTLAEGQVTPTEEPPAPSREQSPAEEVPAPAPPPATLADTVAVPADTAGVPLAGAPGASDAMRAEADLAAEAEGSGLWWMALLGLAVVAGLALFMRRSSAADTPETAAADSPDGDLADDEVDTVTASERAATKVYRGRLRLGLAQHQGDRPYQEDSLGYSDPTDADLMQRGGLNAVVADGMGGLERGDEASRVAIDVFLRAYGEAVGAHAIPAALQAALQQANAQVHAIAQGDAGCTLVSAVVHEDQMHWVSVGDSHIYLSRAGTLHRLNEEHVFSVQLAELVEQGMMDASEAARHPERNALTSYVGIEELYEIDHSTEAITLQPGDRILLCSDGLHGTLSASLIEELLQNDNPQAAADELIRRTIAARLPHQDNVTALILLYQQVES